MTQTHDTFKNLTETQIEEIIAQVEASKPWRGGLRGVELFLLKFYSTTISSVLGIYLIVFLNFHHIEFLKYFSYNVNINIQHKIVILDFYLPLLLFFIFIDFVFLFKKSYFDIMSVKNCCDAIFNNKNIFYQNKILPFIKKIIYIFLFTLTVTTNYDLVVLLSIGYCLTRIILIKNSDSINLEFILHNYKDISVNVYENFEKFVLFNSPFIVINKAIIHPAIKFCSLLLLIFISFLVIQELTILGIISHIIFLLGVIFIPEFYSNLIADYRKIKINYVYEAIISLTQKESKND